GAGRPGCPPPGPPAGVPLRAAIRSRGDPDRPSLHGLGAHPHSRPPALRQRRPRRGADRRCAGAGRRRGGSGAGVIRVGRPGPTVLVLLLALGARPAWPWGCDGHAIVASIASRHLGPAATRQVAALIGHPSAVIFVSRRCDVAGLEPLADVSTWADDIRSVVPTTAPWHFLDIPRGTIPTASVTAFCPAAGCVTRAITEQLAILADAGRTTQERANALMHPVHFVAHVHPPPPSPTTPPR